MQTTETNIICKAQNIKNGYLPRTQSEIEKLEKLDKKVKSLPAAVSIAFGTVASLILGTGMSICLGAIGSSRLFPLGIALGAAGIAFAVANVFIYRAIIKRRKKKYSQQIIELSDKILGNN